MKKVLFVATLTKNHILKFHVPYLKMLKEMGYETSVASRNDFDNTNDCVIPYCDNYYDLKFERNPFRLKNIEVYKQLKKLVETNDYDIVHCHTPVGGVLARLACREVRKQGTKVIYTAHGFHFYKGAPLKNWLIFYPVEKFCSKFTDTIITINKEDYNRALKFHCKDVRYIPGVGIDLDRFNPEKVVEGDKSEFGFKNNDRILINVGDLSYDKNHELLLKVIKKLKDEGHTEYKLLLVGEGSYRNKIENLANQFEIKDIIYLAGWRKDIPELLKMSYIFVFPSLFEGLPVALMEAMAMGLPVVCTNARGNTDLITDNVTGLVSDFDVEDFKNKILKYGEDTETKERLICNEMEFIKTLSIENINKKVKEIYEKYTRR